jgi:RNA polymerase sigma factor (sigma-70 family)
LIIELDVSKLVSDCLKGKHGSQKELYEYFAPKMLGVCYRYALSVEEAEDFLQESFMVIFRKLHKYKGEGELGAWIRRIVVNTSLNGIKARHNVLRETAVENLPELNSVQQPASENELMELIHRLPTGYKTVFNLYAIEGYSHEEIGTMLGIKASTSRSQYTRAREMLKDVLQDISYKNTTDER